MAEAVAELLVIDQNEKMEERQERKKSMMMTVMVRIGSAVLVATRLVIDATTALVFSVTISYQLRLGGHLVGVRDVVAAVGFDVGDVLVIAVDLDEESTGALPLLQLCFRHLLHLFLEVVAVVGGDFDDVADSERDSIRVRSPYTQPVF